MKTRPVLISILTFLVALSGIYHIFSGLRLIGFNFFGAFTDFPISGSLWFWGIMWIVVGIVYLAVARALWLLLRWGWAVASFVAIFGLVSAFFVMFESGVGEALGAALLPAILLLYLMSAPVKAAFQID